MGSDEEKGLREAAELRRQAEERLQANKAELKPEESGAGNHRLLHELEVHQIELEMQNAELRSARDELETALEKYTDLYDFAPVGYFALDREGGVRGVNLTGAELLGVKRAELIGRRFGLFVAAEGRQLFSERLREVFASPDKVSCELTLTREGGRPFIVQVEAVAFAHGEECRLAVLDITERRRIQDELAEKKQELEEINRSLELRIAQAVEDLRQKDQMLILQDRQAVLGEMINNIAHQWNQPLNTLGLVVQQLPLSYDSGQFSRDFLEECTDNAMELIRHMSRTIEDFRNLFKADKIAISFSVNQVIEHTLSLIEKTFKDQHIDIALHSEGDPTAIGFPNEYSQVLLNILLNARDALVGNDVDAARISIRAFSQGGRSVVTITDNAGGIADEHLDKLFDAYFTTKGPEKGTGIGLFMSRTIIEKSMGGRLSVRNTEEGAEFRIEV
jgi:PAS domain S-box-containing protein